MDNRNYIVTLYGNDYISALELFYDTIWNIRFYPDGGIKKLTRYIEGSTPRPYLYLEDTPLNQHAILQDIHEEWKRHLKSPTYRIPLRQVPAGWR